jgi:hypothetical protein
MKAAIIVCRSDAKQSKARQRRAEYYKAVPQINKANTYIFSYHEVFEYYRQT